MLINRPTNVPNDNFLILISYVFYSNTDNAIILYFVDLSKRLLEFYNYFNIRTCILPNNIKAPSIYTKNKNTYIYSFSQK